MATEPKESHVVVEAGARDPALMAQYQQAADRGDCIFCPEKIAAYHTAPTLREGNIFFVTPSQPPRKDELGENGIHLLIIPKHHAEWLGDLPQGWLAEVVDHIKWLINEGGYPLKSYALAVRVGYAAHNGAGIEHLHIHLMQGDPDGGGTGYDFKVFDASRIDRVAGRTNPYAKSGGMAVFPAKFTLWWVDPKKVRGEVDVMVSSTTNSRDITQLNPSEIGELEEILLELEACLEMTSYAIVARLGEAGMNGASRSELRFKVVEGPLDVRVKKLKETVYIPK